MQETHLTQVWSLGQEDPLEKVMVTHSSILAWEIPWTEEPSGLLFMGSQRVEHNWSNSACMHAQAMNTSKLSKLLQQNLTSVHVGNRKTDTGIMIKQTKFHCAEHSVWSSRSVCHPSLFLDSRVWSLEFVSLGFLAFHFWLDWEMGSTNSRASQVALVVTNAPASVGDIRDVGLIPGWGRSPEGGNGNPL